MLNLTSQGKKEIEKNHKVIEPRSLHQFLGESHKTFFLEKSLSNLFWLTCFRTGSASSTVPSTWCTMVRTGAAVMDQEKHSRQGGSARWCWGAQSSDLYSGAAGERGLIRKSCIFPHVTTWLTTPSVLWPKREKHMQEPQHTWPDNVIQQLSIFRAHIPVSVFRWHSLGEKGLENSTMWSIQSSSICIHCQHMTAVRVPRFQRAAAESVFSVERHANLRLKWVNGIPFASSIMHSWEYYYSLVLSTCSVYDPSTPPMFC